MEKFIRENLFRLGVVVIMILGVIYYLINTSVAKSDYLLQEKCSQSASKYFYDLKAEKSGLLNSDYSNHYNKRLNKCLLFANFIWNEGTHNYIYDAVERRRMGVFSTIYSTGEMYCDLDNDKKCSNLSDFNEIVRKYSSE